MSITPEEIEELFKTFRGSLERHIVNLMGGAHLAEDVVQEVFETVVSRADELVFETTNHAKNWLKKRARLIAMTHARTRTKRGAILIGEFIKVKQGDNTNFTWIRPADQLNKVMATEVLERATSNEVDIVYKAYCEDLSLREIAPEAGVSYEMVRLRINKFRTRVPGAVLKGRQKIATDKAAYRALLDRENSRGRKKYAKKRPEAKRRRRA